MKYEGGSAGYERWGAQVEGQGECLLPVAKATQLVGATTISTCKWHSGKGDPRAMALAVVGFGAHVFLRTASAV